MWRRQPVIGEPRTAPIYPRLPGARTEALAVADLFTAPEVLGRGKVTSLISSEDTAVPGPDASEIITALLSRDWRIVHIAGHGEPPERIDDEDRPGRSRRRDGATRGVVLSNDIFLGPREVDSMRVVPELVFVNCCHLAARNSEQLLQTQGERDYDRAIFASGVAEQLIKIGVRCVIAAGWAVEDGPAMTFAKAFYGALLQGQRFIDAVYAARKAARGAGGEGGKTWAAYQCYGDPDWVFRRDVGDAQVPAAPRRNEFADMASPPSLTLALETVAVEARLKPPGDEVQRDRIRQLEASFRFKWGDIGAVAEAFAVAWAATGARVEAIGWYEKAVAANDGSASLKASEQLANLRVLQAWELFDAVRQAQQAVDGQPATAGRRPETLAEAAAASRAVIRGAIADIDRLLALHPTLERHSLRGSANKRLAMIERAVGAAEAEKEALSSMADDYVKAEGAAANGDTHTGLFYPLQNRLSAEAAMRAGLPDWKGPEHKEVARLRQSLVEKSRIDPDFWGLVGLSELQILEARPKHDLAQRAHDLTRELADLHRRVTAPAYWTSVCDQMEFLLGSYEGRVDNEAEREAVRTLQPQVRGYATLQ